MGFSLLESTTNLRHIACFVNFYGKVVRVKHLRTSDEKEKEKDISVNRLLCVGEFWQTVEDFSGEFFGKTKKEETRKRKKRTATERTRKKEIKKERERKEGRKRKEKKKRK